MDLLVPPIHSQGIFSLSAPFDAYLSQTEPVKVVAVRSLIELKDDDPLKNIYESVGLTKVDMLSDVDNEVPIVTFLRQNGDYVYVPASHISEAPPVVGKIYQERLLVATLGLLPEYYDFDLLKNDLAAFIKDRLGVEPSVDVVKNSAPMVVDNMMDSQLTAQRDNNKIVRKSYCTRYVEAEETITKLTLRLQEVENHIIVNSCC